MKRIVRFTNKETGISKEMLSNAVGRFVFDITKDVDKMNSCVRWCADRQVGDKLDNELFSIEVINIY